MDGCSGFEGDVQRLDLLPELAFFNLEVGGRLGDIPAVPHQDTVDIPSFELLPGLFQRPALPAFEEAGEVFELACLDEEGEMRAGDDVFWDHDDEPLDDVHQLADVSRPDIAQKRSDGLRGHGLGLLSVFRGEMA